MQLVPIKSLPNIETEPSTDWALVSHQKNELKLNYLAFAVKRDFLSTPRTYAILSLKETPEKQLKTNEFLLADYLDNNAITQAKLSFTSGFYSSDVNEHDLFLILDDQLLEFECCAFEHVDTLYYCLDSTKALAEYMDNN
jgi:hypothetical protein